MSQNLPESGLGRRDTSRSTFEDSLLDVFGPEPRPKFTSPIAPTGVILCFVNRSGSNYLAECLASSGEFPRAREFFLKRNLLNTRNSRSDLSDVFESIVAKHTLNGIFATKFGYGQLSFFDSHEFLEAAFARTKFIYLKRRDTLDQAISLEIASQNRHWKPGMVGSEVRDLRYSQKKIELKMRGIQKKYDRFDEFFATKDLTPFPVDHDDLVAHPAETIEAAGKFLDHQIRLDPKTVRTEKSPDSLKETWKRRFLAGN